MSTNNLNPAVTGEFLGIQAIRRGYQSGALSPTTLVSRLLDRANQAADQHIWITLTEPRQLQKRAAELEKFMRANPDWAEQKPLLGIPYAVKDNIDVAGVPTTAGCPEYAYLPEVSADAVARLDAAGAIFMGKTNIDQFATGLVGTRSPYGTPENPFNADFIPGGSSSGSAVAVARGLVSFSLGTDTAGSGRVPAAFNNIVGLKPTRGLVSNQGVVPACRSLDCVSIFALTAGDAQTVLQSMQAKKSTACSANGSLQGARFAVPQESQLEFFGDKNFETLFRETMARLNTAGAKIRPIDFSPFLDTAKLLYDGPWVAERYAAVGEFIDSHPDAVLKVTREIIGAGKSITATELFNGEYQLEQYTHAVETIFQQEKIDCLLLPTAPTCYSLEDVAAEPVTLNSHLGYYTNFVNLLNLSALAIPAGIATSGVPFGVTLVAPANSENRLLALGDTVHRLSRLCVGKSDINICDIEPIETDGTAPGQKDVLQLVVCGAHMSGLPLNYQLTELGARLVKPSRTANSYEFFALQQFKPPRPGLIRVPENEGHNIDVEIWELPTSNVGTFLSQIPSPLGLGTVHLEDGSDVQGFICEQFATTGALNISELGSWRNYLSKT